VQQQVTDGAAERQQQRSDVDGPLLDLRTSERQLEREVEAQGKDVLARAQPSVETLEARAQVLATVETVQLVVQDSLVLWRALGALESKKVDKAELVALNVEATGRAEVSRGRAAEARRQLADRVARDVESRVLDWEAVEEALRSHTDQFTQFQDMMRVLAQFVEDLVERIARLRGVNVEQMLETGEQDVAALSASGPVGLGRASPDVAASEWAGRTSASVRPQSAPKAVWGAPNARPTVRKPVKVASPVPTFEVAGHRAAPVVLPRVH